MKNLTLLLLLTCALGLASADAQNFYLSSYYSVAEYSSSGTLLQTLTSGISFPQGLAVDANGNVYVGNYAYGTVWQFGPNGNLITSSFISGLNAPTGLAIYNGDLYVANQNGNTVSEYDLNGNLINPAYASGLHTPRGLAFNSSGDLYVANYGNNTVSEFGPAGNLMANFGSGLSSPYGLAVNSADDLFVANYLANGYISEFDPNGNLIDSQFISSGLNSPAGLAFENGNLFVVNAGNYCISEYGPSGNVINANFSSNFGFGTFMVFAVPEPSVTALALVGLGALFVQRRHAKRRRLSRG
jgi:sugar lactone lactonase YvrE